MLYQPGEFGSLREVLCSTDGTSVSMRVSMASVLENKDPNEVDDQTSDRDRKQSFVVNIRGLQSSLTDTGSDTVIQLNKDEG